MWNFSKDVLNGLALTFLLSISLVSIPESIAKNSNWDIKDGFGDEIQIKNGFFGKKTKVVKSKLANSYFIAEKKGLFGKSNSQEIDLLGNKCVSKKNIFGKKELEISTVFGDKVKSKKGLFGGKNTSVDLSGSSQLLKQVLSTN